MQRCEYTTCLFMSITLLFKINSIKFEIFYIYKKYISNKLTSPCSNSSFSSDVHFKEQPGDFVGERTLGMQEAEISLGKNFPKSSYSPISVTRGTLWQENYSPSLVKLKVLH